MRMILGIVSGPFGEREHADLSRYLTWLRPGDSQRVGRSGYKADMVIPSDQRMSSGHFMVSCEDDGCYVSDMESTNGTFVNGQRIGELTRLHDGDEIVAGSTTFNVQIIAPGRRSTSLELDIETGGLGTNAPAADDNPGGVHFGPQFALELVSGPGVSNLTDTGTLNQGWLPPETIMRVGSSTQEADFLVDGDEFFFLEMNTRLQVEHPVTEMITGRDIVKEQLRIAAGEPLSFTQKEVEIKGHAIECRINAEDPRKFVPSPGRIEQYHAPGGPGVRVDSHIYNGYRVPPYYDSMIGKLICHGESRPAAMARMRGALSEIVIEGIKTNVELHRDILSDAAFERGGADIHYLEKKLGL